MRHFTGNPFFPPEPGTPGGPGRPDLPDLPRLPRFPCFPVFPGGPGGHPQLSNMLGKSRLLRTNFSGFRLTWITFSGFCLSLEWTLDICCCKNCICPEFSRTVSFNFQTAHNEHKLRGHAHTISACHCSFFKWCLHIKSIFQRFGFSCCEENRRIFPGLIA